MIEKNMYTLHRKEVAPIVKDEMKKQAPKEGGLGLSQDQVEQKIKENIVKFMMKKGKADMEKSQKPQLSFQKRQEQAQLRREQINQNKIKKAKELYQKASMIDQIKEQSYETKNPVAWIICKDQDKSLPLIEEFK